MGACGRIKVSRPLHADGMARNLGGRMKRTTIVLIAVIIICLSVAGCGGGGA